MTKWSNIRLKILKAKLLTTRSLVWLGSTILDPVFDKRIPRGSCITFFRFALTIISLSLKTMEQRRYFETKLSGIRSLDNAFPVFRVSEAFFTASA